MFVTEPNEAERESLARGYAYIEQNFAGDPTLQEIARAAGYSSFHFHRRFTKVYGVTPKALLTQLRIEKAKQMLLDGVDSRTIANELTFAHQGHFVARFKQIVGLTPVRWLREQRMAQAA